MGTAEITPPCPAISVIWEKQGEVPLELCFIPCLSQPCHTQPGEQLCWRQGRAPIHPCGGWHCQDMLHGKRFYILGVLKCCLLSRTTCDCFYLGKKYVQWGIGWEMAGARRWGLRSMFQVAQSIISISVLANTSASQLLRAKAPVNKVCIMGILLYTLSDIFTLEEKQREKRLIIYQQQGIYGKNVP